MYPPLKGTIFVEMSWNFKTIVSSEILPSKKNDKPWALSTRSSKKAFQGEPERQTTWRGEPLTFRPSWEPPEPQTPKPTFKWAQKMTWNPQNQWSRRLWNFETPPKKNRILSKTTPQLEVWIWQKQFLFNAKALSRLPTSRSDVMSTPGSIVFWNRNKIKQHLPRLQNSMLKVIKISIRRKQRSFQGNQNSTTSQAEAEKVASNLQSSSLNL